MHAINPLREKWGKDSSSRVGVRINYLEEKDARTEEEKKNSKIHPRAHSAELEIFVCSRRESFVVRLCDSLL